MATVFVMINTELGAESEVLNELKAIEEVKETYLVYGVYDLIARIETETMDELKDIIALNVRRIQKVKSKLSMIVNE
jgi:DNA-binding Lrp family transcriptional regulator